MKFDEIVEIVENVVVENVDDEIELIDVSLNINKYRILFSFSNNFIFINYLLMNDDEINKRLNEFNELKNKIENELNDKFENKINVFKMNEYNNIEIEFNEIVDEFDDYKYFYYISS